MNYLFYMLMKGYTSVFDIQDAKIKAFIAAVKAYEQECRSIDPEYDPFMNVDEIIGYYISVALLLYFDRGVALENSLNGIKNDIDIDITLTKDEDKVVLQFI